MIQNFISLKKNKNQELCLELKLFWLDSKKNRQFQPPLFPASVAAL